MIMLVVPSSPMETRHEKFPKVIYWTAKQIDYYQAALVWVHLPRDMRRQMKGEFENKM